MEQNQNHAIVVGDEHAAALSNAINAEDRSQPVQGSSAGLLPDHGVQLKGLDGFPVREAIPTDPSKVTVTANGVAMRLSQALQLGLIAETAPGKYEARTAQPAPAARSVREFEYKHADLADQLTTGMTRVMGGNDALRLTMSIVAGNANPVEVDRVAKALGYEKGEGLVTSLQNAAANALDGLCAEYGADAQEFAAWLHATDRRVGFSSRLAASLGGVPVKQGLSSVFAEFHRRARGPASNSQVPSNVAVKFSDGSIGVRTRIGGKEVVLSAAAAKRAGII